MPHLVALDLAGGELFVDTLRRVWDRGDAVLPVDQRLPPAAKRTLLAAMGVASVIDDAGEHDHPHGTPADDGDALVVATSGSTGAPKGVVLTHDAVAASAMATSARLAVTTDDHWLACLPLSHVGGLSVVTRALHIGTGLTVLPRFEVESVVAAAQAGANLTSLVATALARIDPAIFRTIVLGGSRPPADRPPNSIATYGLTETGSGVVYDGFALEGVELRIADDGEVLVRGPMLLRCYRDGTTPIDVEGWLHTGDVGSLAPDGRLHVVGRRGDMIVTGGENVWPDAVEAAIASHPAVADVAVAGVEDDEWGQIVTAYVVPTDATAPPTLHTIRDHVRNTIPGFMAPRGMVLIDELPRSGIGKIRRSALPRVVEPPR